MPFTRSVHQIDGAGLRRQFNGITSFLDGSNVYGSNIETLAAVRNGTTCFLKWDTSNPTLGPMLPRDTFNIGMANDPNYVNESMLFLAGDVRANENPGLSVIHTTYLREHNRLCNVLTQQHPEWDGEKLFQEARKWNIAFMQNIFLNEVRLAYSLLIVEFNPDFGVCVVCASYLRYGHAFLQRI